MSGPQNLAELLEFAGKLKEDGASKPVILDSIADICSANGLYLGYDDHSEKPKKNILRVNWVCVRGKMKITTDPSLQPVVHAPTTEAGFFQKRANLDPRRIIIFPQRRDDKSSNVLTHECNGVVIDPETWNVLALPPLAFKKSPKFGYVNDLLKKGLYRVCPVTDGTLVTIYHWEHPTKGGIWCLASNQGYDVSPTHWMGSKCYAEILFDMLDKEKLGVKIVRDYLEEGDCRLSFSKLDKNYSYTIGFRSHNFQPLLLDPERLWDIHQCDLSTCTIVSDKGITGCVEPTIDPPNRVQDLQTSGFLDKAPNEIMYGYTLRSTDVKETGVYSNVLIDTDLLRFIRRIMYGQPSLKKKLNCKNRFMHQAIRALLDHTISDTFLRLYPQCEELNKELNKLIQSVQERVISISRTDALHPFADKTPDDGSKIDIVARAIYGKIKTNVPRFNAHNREANVIVKSYLLVPDHAIIYVPILEELVDI